MNISTEIMNMKSDGGKREVTCHNPDFDCYDIYNRGHRDARHAAAELSLKAEARIEELEAVIKAFLDWTTNEEGTLSLADDEELWKRADDVLSK